MTTEDIQPSSNHRRSLRRGLGLAFLILAVLVAYWFWSNRLSQARETAAAKALQKLGAIVVMDGNHRYAASVNLSTLQSPAALAEALEHLPALSHLTSLDASRTSIRDEQLSFVAALPSLNSLSLNSTAISDAGVERLTTLRNLQTIFLASTQITDRSLAALASLRQLRVVDVSGTNVAANLEPFIRLPQLDWLVLRNLTLTDNSLVQLRDCPSLSRLSLGGSTYSADSLTTLEQALPQTTVDR